MIIHDCEQGTAEWFRLRQGRPTASMFHKIVTPAKGLLSKQSVDYGYKLLVERLLNTPTQNLAGIEHMERGKELEPQAARQYSFVNGVELVTVGFVTTDDGLIGASPDRLIKRKDGLSAGLEIKCPADWTHLKYLLAGQEDDYRPQVQGQMFVCEFDLADFYSFHPRMPEAQITTERDENYIGLLATALEQFLNNLSEMEELAKSKGLFQAFEEVLTPADKERADLELADASAELPLVWEGLGDRPQSQVPAGTFEDGRPEEPS